MIKILKRNGQSVDFDKNKIIKAISKAYKDVNGNDEEPEYASEIADLVYEVAMQFDDPLTVEQIQELVEDYLTDYDKLVAKAYIKYRYKRGVMRSCSSEFIRAIDNGFILVKQ